MEQDKKPGEPIRSIKYELCLTAEEARLGTTKLLTRNAKRLQVKVPSGVAEGVVVKLTNALQSTDGRPGDIEISIKIKSDYLSSTMPSLDASQKRFCDNPSKTLRLLAPAGSGKTLTILYRCVAQQNKSKDKKQRFLIFTFTRGARDELKDRLSHGDMLQELVGYVEITTLNSWGFRRVKSHRNNLRLFINGGEQYTCVYHILQPVWMKHEAMNEILTSKKTLAKAVMTVIDDMKSLGFRHDLHNNPEAFYQHIIWLNKNGLRNRVEAVKVGLVDLGVVSLLEDWEKDTKSFYRNFGKFWCEACEHLNNSAAFTLEDQKYWALIDIEKEIEDGKYTTGMHRLDHILVDEFQDINVLDLNLLKAIAKLNKTSLTIVGDDDQAIYEWRGATPAFILDPDQHICPGYETHLLDINYRSPRNIVRLSQSLIGNNTNRVKKNVKAYSGQDAEITVKKMASLNDSLDFVVKAVKTALQEKTFNRMAIIGRKRSQIIPYQIVFASENIPFYAAEDLQVFLSDAFQQLKEILSIKARAESSPSGPDIVEELLTLCDKVRRFPLSKGDKSTLQNYLYAESPSTMSEALLLLRKYKGPLKKVNQQGQIANIFCDAIVTLLDAETVSESIDAISQNFDGLQKDYGKSIDDIFYADPPFLHLSEYAYRYGSNYIKFFRDVDKAIATLVKLPPENEESLGDGNWKLPLHLMTALRAKGKEFDAVIILDANDIIWPTKLAKTQDELEEERRIFYVAVTRARKRLTFIVNETILGQKVMPTPYLAEMGLNC